MSSELNRADKSETEVSGGADAAARVKFSAADERRRFPQGAELFKPLHWLHWTLGLIEYWAFSRRYGRLFAGLPFLLAVIGGIGFLWWLRHAPDTAVLLDYENGVNDAVRSGDKIRQENYLTALVNLRPREPQYRFRLGLFLVESGRAEGISHILELAPDHADGFVAARQWLVDQASRENPVFPLTDEQMEGQLLRILRQRPNDADSHHRLARIYIRKSEFTLAEDHLQHAARMRPELYVELAQLKKALSRPEEDIQKFASTGVKVLAERLALDRSDVNLRIAMAQTQVLLNQLAQARETLVAGLAHQDDPQLRRALSDFDLLIVDQKLATSVLTRDVCQRMTVEAISTDPSNTNVVRTLAKLQSVGVEFTKEQLQPAISYWRSQTADSTDVAPDQQQDQARRVLSQLYAFSRQHDAAVEELAPVIERYPDLRMTYARMLLKADRTTVAQPILQELLQEHDVAPDADPEQLARMQTRAELLLLADRPEDARAFLREAVDQFPADRPGRSDLQMLLGRACLTMYDAQIPQQPSGYDLPSTPDVTNQQLLEWLQEAIEIPTMYPFVVDRLARLMLSNHSAAPMAEAALTRLRAAQDPGGLISNLVGMHALQAQDFQRARRFLEMAYAQSDAKNSMILNNLAVALIRGTPRDLDRAMELVNKALELTGENSDILSTRAEIHIARMQWNDAYGDLSRALTQRPGSREVHVLLQQVHLALDDPELAAEHARIAESLNGS